MRAPRPAHRPAHPSCYRRRARGYTFKALRQACNGIRARGHVPFPDEGVGGWHSGHAAGPASIQRRSEAAGGRGACRGRDAGPRAPARPQGGGGYASPILAASARCAFNAPARPRHSVSGRAGQGKACVRGHDGGPRRPRVREGGRALLERPVQGRGRHRSKERGGKSGGKKARLACIERGRPQAKRRRRRRGHRIMERYRGRTRAAGHQSHRSAQGAGQARSCLARQGPGRGRPRRRFRRPGSRRRSAPHAPATTLAEPAARIRTHIPRAREPGQAMPAAGPFRRRVASCPSRMCRQTRAHPRPRHFPRPRPECVRSAERPARARCGRRGGGDPGADARRRRRIPCTARPITPACQ